MNVGEFAEKLGMKVFTDDMGLGREIGGMYIGDLLSWVMSHSDKGSAWVTVHTHINIVAVALLTEAACIIIPESLDVEAVTLKKAREEGIPILGTGMNAYEISCKACRLL